MNEELSYYLSMLNQKPEFELKKLLSDTVFIGSETYTWSLFCLVENSNYQPNLIMTPENKRPYAVLLYKHSYHSSELIMSGLYFYDSDVTAIKTVLNAVDSYLESLKEESKNEV